MNRQERGIRVVAVNNTNKGGFDIYLDFSGQTEYLMWHRYNGFLYNTLKVKPRVEDLRRMGGRERKTLKHLMSVIDEYLEDRAA